MAGPNGERCGDCQCWDYQKDTVGYCMARGVPAQVLPAVGAQKFTLVIPSVDKDHWCRHDFVGVEAK